MQVQEQINIKIFPQEGILTFNELTLSSTTPKKHTVFKKCPDVQDLPPSGSKGLALHITPTRRAAPRTEQRADQGPLDPQTPEGGAHVPYTQPATEVAESERVKGSRGLRALVGCGGCGERRPLPGSAQPLLCVTLPRVPGDPPSAPVATTRLYLQLLQPRPGPAQNPAPASAPPTSAGASTPACIEAGVRAAGYVCSSRSRWRTPRERRGSQPEAWAPLVAVTCARNFGLCSYQLCILNSLTEGYRSLTQEPFEGLV